MLTEWFALWLSLFLPFRAAPSKDRLAGSLIGQCLGDALGFVVEGYSSEVCREYVEEILLTDKAGTIGRSPHAFGQYTDDSQLTRELLRSYISCRRFDPADYARHITELFSEQRVVGRGRATTSAAARLANGAAWHEAAEPAPYAGNGAAMRAAPIGWMYPRNDEALIRVAREQARITPSDPRAIAGSVVVAGAVALVLRARSGDLKPDALISTLATWIRPIEPSFAADLDHLHGWRLHEPEDAVWLISRSGRWPGTAEAIGRWPEAEGSISSYVVPSVLWSLYSFLHSPDDYLGAICTAIGGGGDADTTAAMTGAISGAYLGLGAIPSALAERLSDGGTWDYSALLALVDDFAAIPAASS